MNESAMSLYMYGRSDTFTDSWHGAVNVIFNDINQIHIRTTIKKDLAMLFFLFKHRSALLSPFPAIESEKITNGLRWRNWQLAWAILYRFEQHNSLLPQVMAPRRRVLVDVRTAKTQLLAFSSFLVVVRT